MESGLGDKEEFAALVMRLRSEGVSNASLFNAIEQVPRGLFVPPTYAREAWSRHSIPIECGAFAEGVDLAAKVVHLLNLHPDHRVLEIGTGSGYTASLMGKLCQRVLTVDRYRTLVENAHGRFGKIGGGNIFSRQADGMNGLPGEGTFDRILVTAAFTTMPRIFAEQVVPGGEMLAPMNLEDGRCMMIRFTKVGVRFERTELFEVPYLPLEPHMANAL
ncbi:protein-L-isoaspartate(D-aspartate) O-methyltransferase [Rhizobium aquaticum]|uniref:Protein-L-isoaspartate O-methyltransferase n=1 Tax=Rhizobium aquaticum TaxID=1549636 RepID=A0ABV2IWD5_9HYPH